MGQDSSSGQNNNNNNKGAEDVRETNNGWDVSRASITFSPQRFCFAQNFPTLSPINPSLFNIPLPFQQSTLSSRLEDWDAETVCRWFDSMGLYMYTNEVREHFDPVLALKSDSLILKYLIVMGLKMHFS